MIHDLIIWEPHFPHISSSTSFLSNAWRFDHFLTISLPSHFPSQVIGSFLSSPIAQQLHFEPWDFEIYNLQRFFLKKIHTCAVREKCENGGRVQLYLIGNVTHGVFCLILGLPFLPLPWPPTLKHGREWNNFHVSCTIRWIRCTFLPQPSF